MKRSEEFKNRLIEFTISVLKLAKKLPRSVENEIFIRQLIRCASSIGANYSEAIFAHSRIEFVHCLNIARKEASETMYWLEVIKKANPGFEKEIDILLIEAESILKILVSSIKTAKSKVNKNEK